MPRRPPRFVTGSTMRHVVTMSLTGTIGLTFMFLVDVATLFWVSRIGLERNVAALGFAWTVQFFTVSFGIGFMIAATAMVSKSLGQRLRAQARRQATAAAVITCLFQVLVAGLVVIFRVEILTFAGASGQTLQVAAQFLLISVPSLPFMALGMIGSAVLRAEGDAVRAMLITVSSGIVAMVVDPALIFGLGLGVDGAAWGIVLARGVSASLSVWFVIRVHDLAAGITWRELKTLTRPFLMISLPAVLTQISTPFGNYILTMVIAVYGDGAVAGWAVVGRLMVLAFGGIFSLSSSIGGIVGQNFGAGQFGRVRQAYRDALIFSTVYILIAWAILAAASGSFASVFGIGAQAQAVVRAFTHLAAGGFVFTGALFVANAAFNNLGVPHFATLLNWLRDGVLMWPVSLTFGAIYGAPGVIYGQAVAGAAVGSVAALWAWRFVGGLEASQQRGTGLS
jgi:MATE family, multidrug efflux pump